MTQGKNKLTIQNNSRATRIDALQPDPTFGNRSVVWSCFRHLSEAVGTHAVAVVWKGFPDKQLVWRARDNADVNKRKLGKHIASWLRTYTLYMLNCVGGWSIKASPIVLFRYVSRYDVVQFSGSPEKKERMILSYDIELKLKILKCLRKTIFKNDQPLVIPSKSLMNCSSYKFTQ